LTWNQKWGITQALEHRLALYKMLSDKQISKNLITAKVVLNPSLLLKSNNKEECLWGDI
jgi:hypothetical protein